MYNPGVSAPLNSQGEQSIYSEIQIFHIISSMYFCIEAFQKLELYFGTMLFKNNNKICEIYAKAVSALKQFLVYFL